LQKIPDELKDLLSIWKNKMPCRADFSHLTDKILFSELHFTMILHGLNLFDTDKIKQEYHYTLSKDKKQEIEKLLYDFKQCKYNTISHKTMLQIYQDLDVTFNDLDG
jgi:hypothetical protein